MSHHFGHDTQAGPPYASALRSGLPAEGEFLTFKCGADVAPACTNHTRPDARVSIITCFGRWQLVQPKQLCNAGLGRKLGNQFPEL
jgi:hypothetical protein